MPVRLDFNVTVNALLLGTLFLLAALPGQACDAQCEAARKAQDPLASVRAFITDNTIALDDERDPLSYGTSLQPVYSLPTSGSYNIILRGIIPVLGVRNGVVLPSLGDDPRGGTSYSTGLSDSILQAFFSPKSAGDLKWGVGPQVSLKTRTDDDTAGPGWGAGISAVVTGFSDRWSYAAIVGQHWGEDAFSVATINPVLMYNSDIWGGSYIGYSNSITYNWNADDGDRWQVPVGLTFGKTFLRPSGSAIDVSLGAYSLVERPDGAANGQIKIGLSYIWP